MPELLTPPNPAWKWWIEGRFGMFIAQREAHQTSLEGERPDTLTLRLPVPKPDVAVPVIELFLK